jgi:DNA invertase Pin-like site-specific DNA recombinase
MPPDKARAARRMYEAREMTVQQIADVLGVGRSSIYRSLRVQSAIGPSTTAAVIGSGEQGAAR